jgi:hypothetical protein
MAERFRQTDCKPVCAPANHSLDLLNTTSDPLDLNTHDYLSLVGSLMWCNITRPEVSAAISSLVQFTSAPRMAHWNAAIRTVRYLYHTHTLGIVYSFDSCDVDTTVSAYCDASWGNEKNGRSRSGFVTCFGSNIISWRSNKVTTMVCLSTAESEYFAATECVKELVWLRGLLSELGYDISSPSVLLEDNQACITMASNARISGRNRQFATRMHWLREHVNNGTVILAHVSSEHQHADPMTKIMPVAFLLHRIFWSKI